MQRILSLAFALLFLGLALPQGCLADPLFAISRNGRLYSIDLGASGTLKGTFIRKLPSTYLWMDGLLVYNGYFYSSYAPNGDTSQDRYIVRFGVEAGTETSIGNTGYASIGDLAMNSSGTVYASLATSSSGNHYKLGTVDLTTGQVSNVVSTSAVSGHAASDNNIRGMSFSSSGDLYAYFNVTGTNNADEYVGTFNTSTGALGSTYVQSNDHAGGHAGVPIWGMATDPGTGTIHGLEGPTALYNLLGLVNNPWVYEGAVRDSETYETYPNGQNITDILTGLAYGSPSPGFTPTATPTWPAGTPSPTVTPANPQVLQPVIDVVILPTPTPTPTP
jgi:hypothetical protein